MDIEPKKQSTTYYDEDTELLTIAMLKAKEAFYNHIESDGTDGAYFELSMTGHTLGTDFKRINKVTIEEVHSEG